MDLYFLLISFLVLVLLLLVYMLDVNYFIRVAVVFLRGYYVKSRLGFLDASEIHSRVLLFGSDIQLLHMNNARVIREYDFGKLDLWTRIGLMDTLWADFKALSPLPPVFAVATVIRYRKTVHMFAKYKQTNVVTRITYWDGKELYQEQKLVTTSDNITRTLGYSKVIFPFDLDQFVKCRYPEVVKPKPSNDLELWMKYNEANRAIGDGNETK